MDQNLAAIGAASAVQAEAEAWAGQYAATAPASADAPITIAEAACEFGVTLRALRFYEHKGLLSPQRRAVRCAATANARARTAVASSSRAGASASPSRRPPNCWPPAAAKAATLRLTRAKCVEQIKLLERRKRELEAAVAELRQIYTSFYAAPVQRERPPDAA